MTRPAPKAATHGHDADVFSTRETDEAAWFKAAEHACVKAGYVQFLPDEFARFCEAADEVPVLLCRAENVFRLLGRLIEGGDYQGDYGVSDMAILAARAFENASEKEGEHIAQLGSLLRRGRVCTLQANEEGSAA